MSYFQKILDKSLEYCKTIFTTEELDVLLSNCKSLYKERDIEKIIKTWTKFYIKAVKNSYQNKYKVCNSELNNFINKNSKNAKIVWENCLNVMKDLKSESIDCMVTSPPYYNARSYSHWENLNDYIEDMRKIIKEAYRVLDNHRVFVWNVGDIFDNDFLYTKSVWGKRRIPLGAYFIKIFEEEGFTFVDDFFWDKGEVQSERHKNGNKPFAGYMYDICNSFYKK